MATTFALITGATGGLGQAFAHLLANEGKNLILHGRNQEKLDSLTKEFRNKSLEIHTISCDLSTEEGLLQLIDFTTSQKLSVDLLINNAGFGDAGAYLDSVLPRQREMLRLNIEAALSLCHHYGQLMLEAGQGKILNVASSAGFLPGPGMATYFATKAALKSFSLALHEELRPHNISVTCLCPGAVDTGFEAAAHLEGSKLFAGPFVSKPQAIALCGLKALKKNKALCVAPAYLGPLCHIAQAFQGLSLHFAKDVTKV